MCQRGLRGGCSSYEQSLRNNHVANSDSTGGGGLLFRLEPPCGEAERDAPDGPRFRIGRALAGLLKVASLSSNWIWNVDELCLYIEMLRQPLGQCPHSVCLGSVVPGAEEVDVFFSGHVHDRL